MNPNTPHSTNSLSNHNNFMSAQAAPFRSNTQMMCQPSSRNMKRYKDIQEQNKINALKTNRSDSNSSDGKGEDVVDGPVAVNKKSTETKTE